MTGITDIEILKTLGFSFEKGKFSKQITDNCVLQRDANKTEWSVDVTLTNGNVNTMPADRVKDDVVSATIRKETKAVERALNGETGLIQDAVFTEVENTSLTILPDPVGIGGIVRPAVSAREALAAWREFQNLKNAILSKTDLQTIGGKEFVKKSGWRKFATFYNLTDRIVEEQQVLIENGYYWKIKVECTAPNGRVCEGVGICSSTEKKFAHPEHDIYSTAHTRSKNRAISDMIAAGEVSADELEASF